MGKPGQGAAHPEIIDRPEIKSLLRNLTEGSFTLALWAVWIYWILPILTLILWLLFGWKIFYGQFIFLRGFEHFLEVVETGEFVVLIIVIIMLSWSYYNYYWVFKRKGERRKNVRISSERDIARFFKVDFEILEKVKKSSRIEVTLKDGDFITDIPSFPV